MAHSAPPPAILVTCTPANPPFTGGSTPFDPPVQASCSTPPLQGPLLLRGSFIPCQFSGFSNEPPAAVTIADCEQVTGLATGQWPDWILLAQKQRETDKCGCRYGQKICLLLLAGTVACNLCECLNGF